MADENQPGRIRRAIGEMFGKVPSPGRGTGGFWFGGQKLFNRTTTTAINYDRNDYDLWRSIFHDSVINKKGEEYQIAAALGKPIVNITAGFVIGRGVTISLDNENNDPQIQRVEDKLNKWLKKNQGRLFNTAKFAYRDGDAYLHMDEFGKLKELDAKGVEVMLDPISGEVMGCDVKQTVQIQDVNPLTNTPTGTETPWVYVKQYRKNSIRIYRHPENAPDKVEIIWEKVYTDDGAVDIAEASQYSEDGQNLGIAPGTLQERKLAVKMLHNEPDAQAVYGNSDYQNVLAIFRDYAEVIKEAKGSVIYNASPIPVLRGVLNRKQLESASQGDPATTPTGQETDDQGFVWGKDKVLYLNGEKADAKMLQGTGVMQDVVQLLNIYFYLFVQGTETPEFVFGTAVSSSKASTETQIPIFVKKIERKQEEFSAFIQELVETYIERRMLISDPDYLPLLGQELPEITVAYPPIDDEDKTMTLDAVTFAYENKMITGQTALELILGDKVKNISEEIKRAAAEAKEAAKAAAPAQSDRLVSELLKKAAPTATNPQPDANPAPQPATGA